MTVVELRPPTVAAYLSLRASVGWRLPAPDVAARALEATAAAVCVTDGEDVVGMGSLVGHGVSYWLAVDVVVVPTHQGHGVGRRIMDALEAVVAREDHGAGVVQLVAAPDVVAFYERLGYRSTGGDLMVKPVRRGPP